MSWIRVGNGAGGDSPRHEAARLVLYVQILNAWNFLLLIGSHLLLIGGRLIT